MLTPPFLQKKILLKTLILSFTLAFPPLNHARDNGVCSAQVLAEKTSTGYTWTLASRLGALMVEAQKQFGVRDKNWTLLGVDFTKDQAPSIWYPFSGDDQKMIGILITQQAASNEKEAIFQLAHEVVHTLSPTGPHNSSLVFEEGLASHFSIHAPRKLGIDISPDYFASGKYRRAYQELEKLYAIYPDASERIKKLRLDIYSFSDLDEVTFRKQFPQLSSSHVKTLLTRFDQWNPAS
ncbi:MAG: Unknown protein [uncultured Thiotrichaceae bacterium]|uniref:Peptidase M48 domain-containing protein n=1 Tax=uncultured Thiotrichaceae bacterium TaxID=298394 RepID=A0A6S6TLW1_9GAMM|nr:MAG: Unknown protein [uncultured Thiotrichaceae bacterium]